MTRCKACGEEIYFIQTNASESMPVNVTDNPAYMEKVLTFENKWVDVTPHRDICTGAAKRGMREKQLTLF